MKRTINLSWVLLFLLTVTLASSCKKDTKEPAVIASFTFAIDASDFMKVVFTNESKEFKTLSWDFGDASALSAEENPVHTYAATGEFTVKLTATSPGGVTDMYSTKVTITDPNLDLTKLVGAVSKTWKLVREGSASAKYYPLTVGELNPDGTRKGIWWQFGKNEALSKRPCTLNDEYTFTRAGLVFNRDLKGDFWAGDGGIYSPPVEFSCQDVGAAGTTTNKEGVDISAWRNMTGTFVLTPGAKSTLKIVGNGAYIGLEKVTSGAEVKVPQADVTYDVARLVDGTVDTLVIVANYNFDADAEMDAYWEFVLVHYDNPADEPQVEGPKPTAAFDFTTAGKTITCTNTSTDGDTYNWDFGDGQTSSAKDPTHTYTTDGIFAIRLTATNSNGTGTVAKDVYLSSTPLSSLTDAMLQGGAWKVRVEDWSIIVGDGLGHSNWWSVPIGFMTGAGTGVDDWSCIVDDEYKFAAGGVYTFATKGSTRNDGYFGGTNGCISDAAIATSGNSAAFGSASHTYVFTPGTATNNPILKLINGVGKAAFIGFYKGYNGVADGIAGGENSDNTKVANGGSTTNTYEVTFYANTGTKEYMVVSVDYTAAHDRTQGWSTILVR